MMQREVVMVYGFGQMASVRKRAHLKMQGTTSPVAHVGRRRVLACVLNGTCRGQAGPAGSAIAACQRIMSGQMPLSNYW